MSEITIRCDTSVELVDALASDARVCDAARISTGGYDQDAYNWERKAGLIRYLMENRHGTPFEHAVFTFRVECPIFTAREFMRHRIASYNEESARYKELAGVFWVPDSARPLTQEGKPGHYVMKPGTVEQYELTCKALSETAGYCYGTYEGLLKIGVCREVARAALTVAVYTSFYVTMNARSLMNFLSLRIDDVDNTYATKPQFEIQQVALAMQDHFSRYMPLTFGAFERCGRVAP